MWRKTASLTFQTVESLTSFETILFILFCLFDNFCNWCNCVIDRLKECVLYMNNIMEKYYEKSQSLRCADKFWSTITPRFRRVELAWVIPLTAIMSIDIAVLRCLGPMITSVLSEFRSKQLLVVKVLYPWNLLEAYFIHWLYQMQHWYLTVRVCHQEVTCDFDQSSLCTVANSKP